MNMSGGLPGLLVVASLATLSVGCNSQKQATRCEQAISRDECAACCKKAGRSGSTWALDDCECHEN